MKKIVLVSVLFLSCYVPLFACDIKIENHADTSISIASLWVLNYGTTDLDFMNIGPNQHVCYKKSDYDKRSWVADPKSVLNEGRVILHLEGSLAKTLDHTYSSYVHHGKTMKVYNNKVVVK